MDPADLKLENGDRIVIWGGGVNSQKMLPLGTPGEVREKVQRRREVFALGGGFVFNTVRNIQARTPMENVVAMVEALREERRRRLRSRPGVMDRVGAQCRCAPAARSIGAPL